MSDSPIFTHIWRWRKYLGQYHGQACRVLAFGRLNSAKVEFADGVIHVTSRYAVRKIK